MLEVKQTAVYEKWVAKLTDKKTKVLIAERIFRLANGLAGDVCSVGKGINELRIHFGPGYRIYYKQRGNQIIILLCGGSKTSQSRDIEKAKQLAKNLGE